MTVHIPVFETCFSLHKLMHIMYKCLLPSFHLSLSNVNRQTKTTLEILVSKICECIFQWFTPEGFRSLFALVGRNGQGIGSRYVTLYISLVFSSPELKAQVSFSDHFSLLVCLSVRPSVCKLFSLFK